MSGAIVEGREHTRDIEIDADVVIVGSGASGAVMAALLAEAGQQVVVLEEGSHITPAEYGRYRPSQHVRHMWRDASLTATTPIGDSPMINVMMGRCVGGSSLLTGGVCFRTPDYVLDEWNRKHGLEEISPERMDPIFREVEEAVGVQEVASSLRSRSTTLFDEGATKNGHPLKPLRRNVKDCQGRSRCNFGCPHRSKLSVDLNYLPRAVKAGARIYSDCLVDKVVVKGGRAVGVVGRVLNAPRGRRGSRLKVRARRVILAAGAFHTPLLLMRSGVGRENGQVGRNLTLHPGFRAVALFDEEVQGWAGGMQTAYSDAFEKDNITLIGIFMPPGVLGATMPGVGPRHVERAHQLKNMAVFGGMIHDQAGGVVRPAIGREPFVTYELARQDRHSVNKLLRILAEDYFAAGARRVLLPVIGSEPMTPDEFRRFDLESVPAKLIESSSQHPLGTARMGTQPGSSVVNPDGETWEVKDLYVVDGSHLPTSLGVNPQVTVMAMATRLAWKLRERRLPALAA